MPRAPSRCSREGCRSFQPCALHPRGWASSKSPSLPTDWSKRVRLVKAQKICSKFQTCGNLGTQVDHVIPRAWGGSDNDLQLLCEPHHKQKTQEESAWGNKKQIPDLLWWRERWG